MTSSSQPVVLQEALAAECTRVEEDCLYSAKGCFEAGRTWHAVHLAIGIPTVLAAAVAGVSAFNEHPLLAGSLAILVAALSSVSTFLDPSAKAQTFHSVGNRYSGLRARARFLREISSRSSATPDEQVSDLKRILDDKDKLSQESPIIPRYAFKRARKGIEAGEAAYNADSTAARAR